jgi:uncharacterized protein (TIGR02453 family)
MIQKLTLDFLRTLKENNHKAWFDANKGTYEQAKANFSDVVADLIVALAKIDKRYELLQVKDCIFRLNRDVRFSKDKSPYKTHFGAAFSPGGKKSTNPGYYFHLDPEGCFTAAGCWMPEPDQLKRIRQEVDYNLKDFQKITNHKQFILRFGGLDQDNKLVNAPKGYSDDNPAIDILKLKSFTVTEKFDIKLVLDKQLVKGIMESFKAAKPFCDFIENAME